MNLLSVRQRLRRIGPLYRVNAVIRATWTRRQLRGLKRHYGRISSERGITYSEDATFAETRRRIAARRHAQPSPGGSLNVFWVGANLEQDKSGLLPSLEKLGTVTRFSARDDVYGPLYPPRATYDRGIAEANSRALVAQVRARHAERHVDVLIGQLWRYLYEPKALIEIQNLGVATLNISWDDRLPEMWTQRRPGPAGAVGLAKGTDLVLTSSRETCAWYAAEGGRALYWPMASDPNIYRPAIVRSHPVTFVGSRYGIRARFIERLLAEGAPIEVFGPGWAAGTLTATEVAEVFGASKIVLGIGTIGHNSDIVTLKLRDFDAPMSGALYITQYNPDLARLYREDDEVVFYRNITECASRIVKYLNDEPLRASVANAGRARALRDHTWDLRFTTLFRSLDILAH